MKIDYVSKDVTLTVAMKSEVEGKLAKFDSLFRDGVAVKAVVTISILPDRKKAVEISLLANKTQLRAKTIDEDFYAAIDLLIEKLDGQIRKMKTQLKKSNKKRSLSEDMLLEQIQETEDDIRTVVKRKKLSLAPMDEDEAIARMDALGHDFFVYLDSATEKVHVVYNRVDGEFGDIEIEN